MEIGKYNNLTINRFVDFGAYLIDESGNEVLLPLKYITRKLKIGDQIEVFVYTDSADRPVATTEKPLATVGSVALLKVTDVNATGAFLDWGLEKNLLVPYSEQRSKMRRGGEYIVYVYLDDASKRVVASARYERFIDNLIPQYKRFARVEAIVVGQNEYGYKVVVDNRHSGIIYEDQVYRLLEPGQKLTAYIRKIREDGKIDLTLLPPAAERADQLSQIIVDRLRRKGGEDAIGDHLSPEYIASSFQCSKKDFKKAVGALLKSGKVTKTETGLRLSE